MKSIAVVLLIALAAFGVVSVAEAQGGYSPSAPAPSSGAPAAGGPVSTPNSEGKGQVDIDRKGNTQVPARGDDASALPRAVAERTTIFGLSPTAAVMIAAALLVVVILAIVAMTRSNDTYIDTNRRV
jgi:hypothetical protein